MSPTSTLAPEQGAITPPACLKVVIGIQIEHSIVNERILETRIAYGQMPQRRAITCSQGGEPLPEHSQIHNIWCRHQGREPIAAARCAPEQRAGAAIHGRNRPISQPDVNAITCCSWPDRPDVRNRLLPLEGAICRLQGKNG